MDTEEAVEIKKREKIGHPQTDEGPYYHEPWWESYKGGIKGMLGGLIVGGIVGSLIGGMVATAASVALGADWAAIGSIMAAFTAFGMYEGQKKFSQVGIVTGAVAAAHEQAEERMKSFERSRFQEIKQEIRNIKYALMGDKDKPKEQTVDDLRDELQLKREIAQDHHSNYRTQHCDEHCPPDRQFIFWNVALIGAAIGVVAGSLFGLSSIAHEMGEILTHALGGTDGIVGMVAAQTSTVMAVVGGAIGASFGINRDVFRQVFDKTDLWFKGMLSNGHELDAVHKLEQQKAYDSAFKQAKEDMIEAKESYLANPVEISSQAKKETYFQDKISSEAAKKALLGLDHTTSVRN